jgi:nucleolar protein 12
MEEVKLKFAKRKLRVQRCKTIPGSAKVKSAPAARPSTASTTPHVLSSTPKIRGGKALLTSRMPTTVSVPKGDPSLGTRLANMSKEERKQAKSSDADRLARRAAKKKAKTALMKAASKGGDKDARVRKRPGGPKTAGSARKEVKKKVMGKRK